MTRESPMSTLSHRLSAPTEFWSELAHAYVTPVRHYHTLAHVVEVVQHSDDVARDVGWQRPGDVLLAILFHDAVYQAGASDNERRSAELATRCMRRYVPDADIDHARVEQLIELTAAHGRQQAGAPSIDRDAALFLDCDMAILGTDAASYQRYAQGIRAELAPVVPASAFRAGRRHFLERLLATPRIYLSDYFHDRLDEPARRNIGAEIDVLRSDAQLS